MAYQNPFKSPWWLPGPHLQTVWASLLRRRPKLDLIRERLELPDGDFLDLAWTSKTISDLNAQNVTAIPIVLLLHGLNGNVDSSYAIGMLHAIQKQGWRGVLMHFRGCSGEPNRLTRAYHSGETGDLQTVIEELKKREPNTPLYVVGYSLGGNVVLKWLGETGEKNLLRAAVAVSIPFELQKTADHLSQGFSRLYQWKLVRGLIAAHQRKFKNNPLAEQFKNIQKIKNFWEFDEQITAPLHGFKSALDYYTQSSSRQYLKGIAIPTLILHAKNDPFVPAAAIPDAKEVSSSVTLEISETGGHVGFITGKYFWQPQYWLEQRILDFFKSTQQSPDTRQTKSIQ